MANYRNRYMYETSPRKLKPEYTPPKERTQKKNSTLRKKEIERINAKKRQARERKIKCIFYLILAFAVMFAMGFQNSKINEQFSELKASEKQLSSIQKENEQLRVTIENSLNLSKIEQLAKEQIGMQKATKDQTIYIKLPKRDYIELASEQIVMNKDKNILRSIIGFVENIVK